MYNLFWRDPSLPFTRKQSAINVPPGSVVTDAASIRLTGKGFTNYGKIQQENLLRLLENFAGSTAPANATVGQLWYDTTISVLKICVSTEPEDEIWEQLNSYQVSDQEPKSPALGDIWFKKTGPHSGFMYVYNGLGRFPQKTWNAVDEQFYQIGSSPTLGVKLNSNSFTSAEGTSPGSFMLFGKNSSGIEVNAAGTVSINSTTYSVQHDLVYSASVKNQSGYIMIDVADINVINSTFLSNSGTGLGRRVFFVTATGGNWVYDNGTTFRKFTPTSTQYIIGLMSTDVASASIASANIWRNAVPISRFQSYVVPTLSDGKCGGWEQIWPNVDYIGARDEYDAIFNKLMELIGDPIGNNGSGANNRLIDYLPNLAVLDASLQTIILASPDSSIFETSANTIDTVKVLPTSQDWDLLLAACRFAVARLEVGDAVSDIPTFGFVQDGHPLHPTIMNSNPSDSKYLSSYVLERRTNTRRGLMSCFVSFQELMNVLDAGIRSKHLMKGIYESTAASSYANTVVNTTHSVFTGTAANITAAKTLDVTLPFENTHALESFLNSGGSYMFEVSAAPTGTTASTAADLALQTACSVRGKIKVTAGNTIIFNYGNPSTVSITPISTGFDSVNNGGTSVVHTYTTTSLSFAWSIGKTSDGTGLRIVLTITPTTGATFTNTITVRTSYIFDNIKYAVGTSILNVYSPPLAFNVSNATGTGITVSPTVYYTA